MIFEIRGASRIHTIDAQAPVIAAVATEQIGADFGCWNVEEEAWTWEESTWYERKRIHHPMRFERRFGISFFDVMVYHWRLVIMAMDSLIVGDAESRAIVLAAAAEHPGTDFIAFYHAQPAWGHTLRPVAQESIRAIYRSMRGVGTDGLDEIRKGKAAAAPRDKDKAGDPL